MNHSFDLHERLAADCVNLADWPLCRVLLMNDASYPWLILVPRRPGLREFHQVDSRDMPQLVGEICDASRALETLFRPDKINVGALGNMVPQLHIHLIARFKSDAAWPGPVWGAQPAVPYEKEGLRARLDALTAALGAA
ncbi:HIT family protein [Pelagibius sp. CAU 1746]|uniref:HIT family protein n=1 Tax=Pelagibius sp. CAU 1746 TaxID=3140370 RepID=UPI00325B72B5